VRPATDAPTYSDADRTGLSATTFLILCIWLGPRLACSLPIVVAIATLWFLACRRWPIVAVFTAGFKVVGQGDDHPLQARAANDPRQTCAPTHAVTATCVVAGT
jgi:hypothetical protein